MIGFYRVLGPRVREVPGICSIHFGDHMRNSRRPSLWQNNAVPVVYSRSRPRVVVALDFVCPIFLVQEVCGIRGRKSQDSRLLGLVVGPGLQRHRTAPQGDQRVQAGMNVHVIDRPCSRRKRRCPRSQTRVVGHLPQWLGPIPHGLQRQFVVAGKRVHCRSGEGIMGWPALGTGTTSPPPANSRCRPTGRARRPDRESILTKSRARLSVARPRARS